MSKPREYENKLLGAIEEMQSVASSLHMYPEPIEDLDSDALPFLDEQDKNVKHATEHLRAAKDLLREYMATIAPVLDFLRELEVEAIERGPASISKEKIHEIRQALWKNSDI